MSKIIYIASQKNLNKSAIQQRLYTICKALEPDNIISRPPKIEVDNQVAYGVMNPEQHLLTHNNSIVLGQLFNQGEDRPAWYQADNITLDGSFAIFRDNPHQIEIISDPTASKTIWYYHDDDYFIASTSQRAIIMFLESFEFDQRVIPWILSTGTLGPTHAWDKRIKRLEVDTILTLNKESWESTKYTHPIQFNPSPKEMAKEEKHLEQSLRSTIKHLNVNFKTWRLPLSGGYDSRGLLALFYQERKKQIHDLKTVTWGIKELEFDPQGDAAIAKKVANYFSIPNQYYYTESSQEPIEIIIERFLHLGEGRIENINGYMDGFSLWKQLYEDGVEGIIRGDEGFGWSQEVSSALQVRYLNGCALCSDFDNLKKYPFTKQQELPQQLQQQNGESLALWRDRLHHAYRLPTFSAALSDLKSAYVDVVNPILSRKLIQQIRTLPEPFRDRSLFESIVDRISPNIEFATKNSIASHQKILSQKNLLSLMLTAIESEKAHQLFPKDFLKSLSKEAQTQPKKDISLQKVMRKLSRIFSKRKKAKTAPKEVNAQRLLFRVYLILRMNEILNHDAKKINHEQ